jgi:hypothetical protein
MGEEVQAQSARYHGTALIAMVEEAPAGVVRMKVQKQAVKMMTAPSCPTMIYSLASIVMIIDLTCLSQPTYR